MDSGRGHLSVPLAPLSNKLLQTRQSWELMPKNANHGPNSKLHTGPLPLSQETHHHYAGPSKPWTWLPDTAESGQILC